jgi:cytochrome c oxidase cbb3-type subunit IV
MAIGSLIFDMRSIVTVASLITFLGIVWWTYSGRRRESFDEAAMLPLIDDNYPAVEENKHG